MIKATDWLIQPGIVKKLQIGLALSICMNIFFILNKIPKIQQGSPPKQITQEVKVEDISELEIKNFIKDYLNYFFGTGLVAQSFIEKHSQQSLYNNELKSQLEMRTSKDLKSNFSVVDFYIEPEAKNNFRVILVGIESFENKDYQNREITMILNIEKQDDDFIVNSVPKFEVKG